MSHNNFNHFNNFIFLPRHIHELKNTLNHLQDEFQKPHDQGRWVLMIVPEAGPGQTGYVAPPQTQQLTTHGGVHVQRTSTLQMAVSTANQVDNILENIALNPEQKKRQEELLKPALDDMTEKLTTAFNDASKPRRREDFKSFRRFYEGEKFSALRLKVEALPLDKTVQLRKTLESIDSGINSLFNRHAKKKPANNNKSQPQVRKASKRVIPQPRHVPRRGKNRHGHRR